MKFLTQDQKETFQGMIFIFWLVAIPVIIGLSIITIFSLLAGVLNTPITTADLIVGLIVYGMFSTSK